MHHPLFAFLHLIVAEVANHIDEGGADLPAQTLRQIVGGETRPHGAIQLRRHRAVGLIVDAPQHLLAQRVIQLAVLVLNTDDTSAQLPINAFTVITLLRLKILCKG